MDGAEVAQTTGAIDSAGLRAAAAAENFPVVGRLTRGRVAGPIRAFYGFARGADDVADAVNMAAPAKLAILDAYAAGLEGAVDGAAPAATLRRALAGHDQEARALAEARRLLGAFRQDAAGSTYPDWDALAAYCAMSAEPVGRFLLAVHGEDRRAEAASNPLCAALQVLNHLQDLRDDRDRLGRVYVPADMLAAAGADAAALSAPALSQAARRAVDAALDRCDALLDRAAPLPRLVRSRALAAQAAATLHLARRLSARLRAGDPLAARVRPSRRDFAMAGARGLLAAMRGMR